MCNIVAYGSIETREHRGRKRTVRVLHTNAAENYYAKCQIKTADGLSVFPSGEIVNPTLPGILEAIQKGRPQPAVRRRRRRETK
jgi:hypothetical protein